MFGPVTINGQACLFATAAQFAEGIKALGGGKWPVSIASTGRTTRSARKSLATTGAGATGTRRRRKHKTTMGAT